jgi:transcriptional regulator with XRE-family HTH domain
MKHASSSFGKALRAARRATGLAQEEFDQVSSRTYVSALERGIKQPTVPKVDALAKVLGLHPLTLLVLSYVERPVSGDVKRLLEQVQREADLVIAGSARGVNR